MRTLLITMLVVVAVFMMISINVNLPHDSVGLQFAIDWTQRAFGALIAAVAGVMLLVRAAQSSPLEQLLSSALAVLVGVLIVEANWGVAVAIGAIGVAAVLRGRFSRQE